MAAFIKMSLVAMLVVAMCLLADAEPIPEPTLFMMDMIRRSENKEYSGNRNQDRAANVLGLYGGLQGQGLDALGSYGSFAALNPSRSVQNRLGRPYFDTRYIG